jgi:uncharacterized protein YjiS (DUF1127 family)
LHGKSTGILIVLNGSGCNFGSFFCFFKTIIFSSGRGGLGLRTELILQVGFFFQTTILIFKNEFRKMYYEKAIPHSSTQAGLKRPAKTSTYLAEKWSSLSAYRNPFRVFRALERMQKFRSLDDAALLDMGLSKKDVDDATLRDFLKSR